MEWDDDEVLISGCIVLASQLTTPDFVARITRISIPKMRTNVLELKPNFSSLNHYWFFIAENPDEEFLKAMVTIEFLDKYKKLILDLDQVF